MKKAARRRLDSSLLTADQAAIKAGLDFRRYVMKPTPAKPSSIIAQVESSGAAEAEANVAVTPSGRASWNGSSMDAEPPGHGPPLRPAKASTDTSNR